jgi:4-hydroxybenzoate polyprenyltransferase
VVDWKQREKVKALKALYWSSRPISWVNTAFPFFVAYYFVSEQISIQLLVGTFFFLIPYNFLMYGINDVFDYESDLRNPRKGGIEGALLDPKLHSLTIWLSVIFAGAFTVYLLLFGTAASDFWLLLTLFAVFAYSVPKLRFKERPFLDSFTSALHFVGPATFGLVLAGGDLSNQKIVLILLAFMAWGMASHAFGAVQDVRADREANIKSVATAIGSRFTVRFSFALYLLSMLALVLAGGHAALAAIAVAPYLVIISPYLNIKDEDCEKANRGWKKFIWLNFLAGAIISLLLINFKQMF